MAWLDENDLQKFKKIGRHVLISKDALILGPENIEIGDNVRIDAHAIILASKGFVSIGNHVHIAVQTLLSAGGGIFIGDFAAISMGTKIISATDDPTGGSLVGPVHPEELTQVTKLPIMVDAYAWLGTNTVLMPGSHVCEGAMLGANSFVGIAKSIPSWVIYAGNPLKPIKSRKKDMIEKAEEARRIFEFDQSH